MSCPLAKIETMQEDDWLKKHEGREHVVVLRWKIIPAPSYWIIVHKCSCGATYAKHEPKETDDG